MATSIGNRIEALEQTVGASGARTIVVTLFEADAPVSVRWLSADRGAQYPAGEWVARKAETSDDLLARVKCDLGVKDSTLFIVIRKFSAEAA
jgi:hypothetical protein